jgi:pimeloyl-ACP methyl ester carboxylesterase
LCGAACAADSPKTGESVLAAKSALVKLACTDSVDSVYKKPGNLPPLDESRRGDVVRCAQGASISSSALQSALSEAEFTGVEVKSGVQLYRISYRTQRAVQGADVASALVAVPLQNTGGAVKGDSQDLDNAEDRKPQADDEDKGKRGPVVVYGHGTVPYRQDCGYSRSDPLTATFLGGPDLELRTFLALAAQGFPVIFPDYAGFVAGSTVSGYMFAEDEAYSVLDATRAMKKLLEQFPDQVALVGHSQGGHAVLAAQSYAQSYGMAGKLAGVVALAPFWAPARAFGIVIWPPAGYKVTHQDGAVDEVGAYALNTAIEYFYTHSELIDDAGSSKDILSFNINNLLGGKGTECNFFPDLTPYGDNGEELFKPPFAAVGVCAGTGECDDPLAQKWAERWAKDRPALNPEGAPVLMWQGGADQVVPTSIAGCAIDKLRADLSDKFKVCADASADHETIENHNAAWVIQWIKARAQGAPEPTQTCAPEEVLEGLDCFVGNFE